MRFLLYTRPETNEYFHRLVEKVNYDAKKFTISDFKDQGDIWMGEYLNDKSFEYDIIYFGEELQDIIERCRFLRKINFNTAKRLVNIYATIVSKLMDENKFNFVFSQIIDNYCMDVIEREATKRKIPVIATCVTFINGYSRFTIRGEWRSLNKIISNDEIDGLLKTLLDTSFKGRVGGIKAKSKIDLYKIFYRRLLIEKLYYPLIKLIKNDKYNYHYNTKVLTSSKSSDYIFSENKYYSLIDELNYKNCVYVPLHCTPEATTDYFGSDKKFGNYEKLMIDFFENSDDKITFLVKEHPAMMGWRHKDFYEELKKYKNVKLISPKVSSNLLLQRIDNVVTCTGSVGVEALLKNKKVFLLTENYYSDKSPNAYVIDYLKQEDIDIPIKEYSNKKLMEELLSGFINIHIYGEREMYKIDIDGLAKEIKKYYNVF